uniref:Uncharacterized protein n=1 Tax=Physcomitrium patens TaxID=3218 RepID=A0A2K1IH27_PHYPA|nr:hypothetical protein PHYPA_029171 [Physcomitrium patens]
MKKVEESNNSSLKLCSTTTVDGGRTESFPNDVLTAGQNRRKELVNRHNNDSSEEELDDDQNCVASAELFLLPTDPFTIVGVHNFSSENRISSRSNPNPNLNLQYDRNLQLKSP